MQKITLLLIPSLFISALALASPHPKGFENNDAPRTIAEVNSRGHNNQIAIIQGRITNFFGDEIYEFTDLNGDRIEIELDDDRDWSYIAKDDLLELVALIDIDLLSTTLEVKKARVLQKAQN